MQDSFVGDQLQIFAVTVGLGFLIGLAYDFMGAGKNFIRFSRGVQFFIDFFFCLIMTIIVFIVLLASNWGEVRGYVFMGLGTGGLFYILFLRRIVSKLLLKTFSLLIRIAWSIAYPGMLLVKKINRLLAKIKEKAGKFSREKKE